jgi:hypothetical protein
MSISRTGDGLNVLITCEQTPAHDWMAFAAWYSFTKYVPDAVTKIICRRQLGHELFSWPQKTKTTFRSYSTNLNSPLEIAKGLGLYQSDEQVFVIEPWTMAVCELDHEYEFSELHVEDAKSEKTSPFVSYFNGCCKFVFGEWINRTSGNPFSICGKLQTIDLTLNERRVLDMWDRCHRTYMMVVS